MLEIVLTGLVLVLIFGLCLHHHHMKLQLSEAIEADRDILRQVAAHSITASNTVNPVTALCEVSAGERLVQLLHEVHGPHMSTSRTGIDTRDLMQKVKEQKKKIVQDIMYLYPDFVPKHPLNHMVDYGSARRNVIDEAPSID